MKAQLSGFENFWYYLWAILSLGIVYLWKVIIKKAIIETQEGDAK